MTALVRSFMSLGEVITRHLVFRGNILQVIADHITLFLPAAFFPVANHCDDQVKCGGMQVVFPRKGRGKFKEKIKIREQSFKSKPTSRRAWSSGTLATDEKSKLSFGKDGEVKSMTTRAAHKDSCWQSTQYGAKTTEGGSDRTQ
jgi:hypothetical protein